MHMIVAVEIIPIPKIVCLFFLECTEFLYGKIWFEPLKEKCYCISPLIYCIQKCAWCSHGPGIQKVLNSSSLEVRLDRILWPNSLFTLPYYLELHISECGQCTSSISSIWTLLSEMQVLRPHHRPTESESAFKQIPCHLHAQWFWVASVQGLLCS